MSVLPVPSRSALPFLAGLPAESQPGALRRLDSDVLLRQFASVQARSRVNTAEVLVHVIEVHRRKLWRAAGRSSMYKYCIQVMHMSEAEAFRRVKAAHIGRRFPVVLEAIADGRLHLTAVVLLAPYVRHGNVNDLVAVASHCSRKQIQQVLAERFPKPDAPTVMRTLVHAVAANSLATSSDNVTKLALEPVDPTDSNVSAESAGPLADVAAGSAATKTDLVAAAATQIAAQIVAKLGDQSGECGVARESSAANAPAVAPQAIFEVVTDVLEQAVTNDPGSAEAIEQRAKLTPLSPGRHCWQLTVDQETQDLMDEALNYVELGSNAPQEALKQALRCFVEQRRKQKFAQVSRPREQRAAASSLPPASNARVIAQRAEASSPTPASDARVIAQQAESSSTAPASDTRVIAQPGEPRSRHIPADVKRAVFARDGGRCTFESADGTRCDERRDLQFDHRIPFASGGNSTVDNVRQLCPEHNRHEAERAFGPEHVQAKIHESRARSERTKGGSYTP